MTPSPVVLITGVGGQDGALLTQQLNSTGWPVWGVVIPGSSHPQPDPSLNGDVRLVEADLSDTKTCRDLVADIRPDIVFHLAAISSVGMSWESPVDTAQVNGMASVALMAECLELTRRGGRQVRFVNASSAEIFAGTDRVPQAEDTPLAPVSPYGAAKAFAHMMGVVFRSRGLAVSNAILYNHESPLRPTAFVTRKITSGVAAISIGAQQTIRLGNLDARRDWGWAPDYVDCMVRMARQEDPGDFVVATGVSHSVREFVAAAFGAAGIEDWHNMVEIDHSLTRPADSMELVGDAAKAELELSWRPTKTFVEVVAAMVQSDLELARGESQMPRKSAEKGAT